MTMQTFDGYYVFEADQVLTNDHLNQQFYYLDWQERLTRNKLIGTGIVCGLDITSAPDKVTISKGSGVTSEGYLIVLDKAVTYDNFVQYKGVPQPADLPFASAWATTGKDLPFFDKYCQNNPNTVFQLLDSTQYTTQNPLPVGSALLPTLTNPGDYAVVLFIEMNEKDLKNCDTQDCNNKGEKMEITILALLVQASKVSTPFITSKAKEIKLARYNVPYMDINDAAGVLNGFQKILKNGVLDKVAAAYAYCFDRYSSILTSDPSPQNPFSTGSPAFAQQLQTALTNAITNNNGLTIQYLYDYIDDLILAYYEFRETASNVLLSQCVGHELDFPLHLVLGAANASSDDMVADPYRTYFIYSAIFNAQNQGVDQVRFLFNRMKMMAATLKIPFFTTPDAIQITPSQYGDIPLSERCIPFYYDPLTVTDTPINQVWNYYKTYHGNEDFILGYYASKYNGDDSVISSLSYDIEKYNFFRIEGHIGQKCPGVLEYLHDQRSNYNLPFDVVAISAELLSTGNQPMPECNVVDLESEYRLLVIEFLSKIYLCFYKFLKLSYEPTKLYLSDAAFDINTAGINDIDEDAFLANFTPTFLAYKYGDFINSYTPASASASAGTNIAEARATVGTVSSQAPQVTQIGLAYATYIKTAVKSGGTFDNPMLQYVRDPNLQNTSVLQGYTTQFGLLNDIDVLFYLLLNTKLADLTAAQFTKVYEKFNDDMKNFEQIISNRFQTTVAFFTGCGCDCLVTIAKEILELLKEYQGRVQQYLSQLSFLNYYQKHPGLEHKAGVPKGGTFVLVYHTEATAIGTSGGPALGANQGIITEMPVEVMKEQTLMAKGNAFMMDDATLKLIRKLATNCDSITLDEKNTIISNLPPAQIVPPSQTPPAADIQDDVIIADFYIPYLCCSDCSPIAYIVNTNLNVYTVSGGGIACSDDNKFTGISTIQLDHSDKGVNYTLNSSAAGFQPITLPGTDDVLPFRIITYLTGIYKVTAVSADGNTRTLMRGSAPVTIVDPPLAPTITGNDYCAGTTTGAELMINDPESDVQYQLFQGTTAMGQIQSGPGPLSLGKNILKGDYKVVATSAGKCSTSTTVTVNERQLPDSFDVNASSYCKENTNGGSVTVQSSEAEVTYQLYIKIQNNFSAVQGASIKSTTPGGPITFNNLPAGTYKVTAQNNFQCSVDMKKIVEVTVLDVQAFTIENPVTVKNVDKDGNFVIGLKPSLAQNSQYTYAWGSTDIGTRSFVIIALPRKYVTEVSGNVRELSVRLKKAKLTQIIITLNISIDKCKGESSTIDITSTLKDFEQTWRNLAGN